MLVKRLFSLGLRHITKASMASLREGRDMRRAGWFLVAAVLFVATGCGAIPPSAGSEASGARTTVTPAVSPSSSFNYVLEPGDCIGPALGSNATSTKSLGMDSITLKIPPGWSDQTNQVTGVSALLRIQEPAQYGSDGTTFELDAIPGPRPGSSAHEQA